MLSRLQVLDSQKDSPDAWRRLEKLYVPWRIWEPNELSIPITIWSIKDTIEFYYNSYDIAAYAFGPTVLKIPVSELKPVLSQSSPYYKCF